LHLILRSRRATSLPGGDGDGDDEDDDDDDGGDDDDHRLEDLIWDPIQATLPPEPPTNKTTTSITENDVGVTANLKGEQEVIVILSSSSYHHHDHHHHHHDGDDEQDATTTDEQAPHASAEMQDVQV